MVAQTFTFCVFLVVFAYSVVYTHQGRFSAFPGELRVVRGWLIITAATALLIQLRTSFRLAESAQGVFGYLSTHEVRAAWDLACYCLSRDSAVSSLRHML